MKKRTIGFLMGVGVCFLASSFIPANDSSSPKDRVIAISQIVEHPALNRTRDGLVDELNSQKDVYNYKFIMESAQGSPLLAMQIAQKFIGMKPSIIVAISTPMAQAAFAANKNAGLPIVFTSVTDPLKAHLVESLQTPGSKVTGVSNQIDTDPQLALFKRIVPGLQTIGIIYNPAEVNSLRMNQVFEESAKKQGIVVKTKAAIATTEVGPAAAALASEVDALFVTNDSLVLSAFDSVVREGNRSGTPVFVSDVDMVERGAIAAYGPNQYELGKQTARMVLRLLDGQDSATMPVEFPQICELYLNIKAVRQLNLTIPVELIQEADFIIEDNK